MKTKAILISMLLVSLMALASTSHALRCTSPNGTSNLVSSGDYHFEVIRKCGPPEYFGKLGGVQSDVQVMSYTINGMHETLIFRMGRLESEKSSRF